MRSIRKIQRKRYLRQAAAPETVTQPPTTVLLVEVVRSDIEPPRARRQWQFGAKPKAPQMA